MATLPTPRADFSRRARGASDAVSSVDRPDLIQMVLVHELSSDLVADPIKRELLIEPSAMPTRVTVHSSVAAGAARGLNSPQYLATVRRRRATKLANMFASLAKKAHRDDFGVSTLGIVEEVHELLVLLTDVQREGNTREVLRQVRDTFLDGGHERYRDPKAREVVVAIFDRLAHADEVTPDEVDRVWDELDGGGLSAPIPLMFALSGGEEGSDG